MKENQTTLSSPYRKSSCFFLPSPSVFDPISLAALPPTDDLQILLNRIELQLPKDDHVKYDSRQVIKTHSSNLSFSRTYSYSVYGIVTGSIQPNHIIYTTWGETPANLPFLL
jgi:hypothetical protein